MKVVLLLLHLFVGVCRSAPNEPMQGINTTLDQDPCMQQTEKIEFLISVEVKGTETWITTFSSNNHDVDEDSSMNSQVQTSSGPKKLNGKISRGCGDEYSRCRDLLVETTRTSAVSFEATYILFVPLEDRVHLVELTVNNDSTVQFGDDYGIRQTIQSCSPSAMFKIENTIYTTCINSEENSVALYEIRLNRTSLSQSYMLPMPNGEYTFQPDQTIATASNFLYMEWNYNTYIFFAIDYFLYAIRPSENSINDDYEPIGANCRNVKELVLTGNDGEILAYCDDHLVYYSIDYADWTLQDMYTNAGRRYICPDRTLHLSVFAEGHYITYNVEDLMKDVTVSNSILNGVCYSSANHSYFAYIEQVEGLFLLDTLTANVAPITTTSCHLNTSCKPLLIVQNQYLIVQSTDNNNGGGGGTVWVRDMSSNMSVVVEAQHTSPDLLTLVVDTFNVECIIEPENTESPITYTEGEQSQTVIKVSLPVVIASVLAGIGIITCTIGIVIYRHRRSWLLPRLLPVEVPPPPPIPGPSIPSVQIIPVTTNAIQASNEGTSMQVCSSSSNLEQLAEGGSKPPMQEESYTAETMPRYDQASESEGSMEDNVYTKLLTQT